jgi:hypothetical protein
MKMSNTFQLAVTRTQRQKDKRETTSVKLRTLAGLGAVLTAMVLVPISQSAPVPRLKTTQADKIALKAAEPYTKTGLTTNAPTKPLAVTRTRIGHIDKNLVWLVDLQATVFVFPCSAKGTGAAASCPPRTSQAALATIADKSGKLLSITPLAS